MDKLIQFIEDEMKQRDMSIRAFALHCDISKSQMSNVLNKTQSPGLQFLEKLATGTNTSLSSIILLVFPESDSYSPEIEILAQRIANLPPADRETVEAFVLGLALKRKNKTDNSGSVSDG